MKPSKSLLCLSTGLLFLASVCPVWADDLKSADLFAVLAGSTVTNAGAAVLGDTQIFGNVGVYAGSACTGFEACPVTGPGDIFGMLQLANNVSLQAQKDLTNAYTTLGAMTGKSLPGGLLGGLVLGPGVYTAPTLGLTGTLTLNDHGKDGSVFIFVAQSSTLITASGSKVDVSGLSPHDKVFWIVGSSATLGDNTVFEGNILALTDINFDPGASIGCGRALTRNGQVTFAGQDATSGFENQISLTCIGTTGEGGGGFNGGPPVVTGAPEPATYVLLFTGIFCIVLLRKRFTMPAAVRSSAIAP